MNPSDIFPQFTSPWRSGQYEAIKRLVDSNRRFNILGLPVGLGKSLVGLAYAKLSGLRTVVLTSTRALQDQYSKEFGEAVADLRGLRNYPCGLLLDRGSRDSTCDLGPCHDGEECVYRAGGCEYYDAVEAAGKAEIVLTNYSMYYTLRDAGLLHKLGKRELLICDEAHDAAGRLGSYVGVSLNSREVRFPFNADQLDIAGWKQWANETLGPLLDIDAKSLRTNRDRKNLRSLLVRLAKLSEASEDWRPDWRYADGWAFEPVWARGYTAEWLWGEFEKVVLLSATLRPVSAEEELGLKGEDYEFFETASPYPPERRPIVHIKTSRVNHKMSEIARERWIGRVDEILETRGHYRGIIHTVSFDRARQLLLRSRFASRMFVPKDGADSPNVLRRFRDSTDGILVSPSVHTGHDFPGDLARYQIIVKVPYPDTRFGLAAARAQEDPDWARRQAAVTLVQMSGRIVRGPEDWGETLVIDDNVVDLYNRHKYLFPQWFRVAYRSQVDIPEPLGV